MGLPFERWPVHPRACGERAAVSEHGHMEVGSSPRLRGTDQGSQHGVTAVRFIPAPAGNGIL